MERVGDMIVASLYFPLKDSNDGSLGIQEWGPAPPCPCEFICWPASFLSPDVGHGKPSGSAFLTSWKTPPLPRFWKMTPPPSVGWRSWSRICRKAKSPTPGASPFLHSDSQGGGRTQEETAQVYREPGTNDLFKILSGMCGHLIRLSIATWTAGPFYSNFSPCLWGLWHQQTKLGQRSPLRVGPLLWWPLSTKLGSAATNSISPCLVQCGRLGKCSSVSLLFRVYMQVQ